MSAERRRRPSAVSARIASQPYPATEQRLQTIQAWVASLEDAPQPQLGRLASRTLEAPLPPPPPQLPIEAHYPSIPALVVATGWVEPSTDNIDYHAQGALASALPLPLPPLADYSNLSRDIRMKEPWERSTIASTMHTVSMLDWKADADAGSEFETMSDWTARPPRGVGEVLILPVPPQEEGEKKAEGEGEKGEGEEVSDYAPSSRSVTPQRKVLPRKARGDTTTPRLRPRQTADLDEEYDERDIDLDAAISGETSEPKAKKRRYVSSSTAVEDHSTRSSPSPPPPSRRRGVLRGKVARRASFRPTAHFRSRDAAGSDSA